MKIEIWCDFSCPYSYMGAMQFYNAKKALPFSNQIEFEWRSFIMDPELKNNIGEPRIEFVAKKYEQAEAWAKLLFDSLEQQASKMQLSINLHKQTMYDTHSAHMVLQQAKLDGIADEVAFALFDACLNQNENLSDITVLQGIVDKFQFTQCNVESILTNNSLFSALQEDIQIANELGIQTVPFFIIDEAIGMEGMQTEAHILGVLHDIYEQKKCA
jgi:protein disulfide-isomerase